MVAHLAEWAMAVLAGGVVAGLVVVAAVAGGGWLVYRRVRRRVAGAAAVVAGSAVHGAEGAGAGRRVRVPPRVVHDLRRRINGPPDVR